MRQIKQLHKATYSPIADLVTYRALPTQSINYIDPFLFLNHHGPQTYTPKNRGLPFGPHPHRGMATVTFILEGDIQHKDSSGHVSVITAGGVQWMKAGSGLIHAEESSDEFKKLGGPLEILQLWVNLPAKLKMTAPFYQGLQQDQIPGIEEDGGRVRINLISGTWNGKGAAFTPESEVRLNTIYFNPGGKLKITVPEDHNIFFYVIRGALRVNGTEVPALHLADFDHNGANLELESTAQSILLFGHAAPLNEPVVAQGPFVMNIESEIIEAYRDYQAGKFGSWEH